MERSIADKIFQWAGLPSHCDTDEIRSKINRALEKFSSEDIDKCLKSNLPPLLVQLEGLIIDLVAAGKKCSLISSSGKPEYSEKIRQFEKEVDDLILKLTNLMGQLNRSEQRLIDQAAAINSGALMKCLTKEFIQEVIMLTIPPIISTSHLISSIGIFFKSVVFSKGKIQTEVASQKIPEETTVHSLTPHIEKKDSIEKGKKGFDLEKLEKDSVLPKFQESFKLNVLKLWQKLQEILNHNLYSKDFPREALWDYREALLALAKLKTATIKEKGDMEYYASGCALNYHLRCVKNIRTEEDLLEMVEQASKLIEKHGEDLEPHPLYKIYQKHPSKTDFETDKKLRSELKDEKIRNMIEIFTNLTSSLGIDLILTNERSQERDVLDAIITGKIHHQFVKLTFTDKNEEDFKKMAQDQAYAKNIYKDVRKVLNQSNLKEKEYNLQIVAVECNSPLTFILLVKSALVAHVGGIRTGAIVAGGIMFYKYMTNTKITSANIYNHLNIQPDLFDARGDQTWDPIFHWRSTTRGNLPYFFPKGWRGFGLKVLDEYNGGNGWLRSNDHGWAVGYACPPNEVTVRNIFNDEAFPQEVTGFANDEDTNLLRPVNRNVGDGIKLYNKIPNPTHEPLLEFEQNGTRYWLIIQCRLEPEQIRIPGRRPDLCIMPDRDEFAQQKIIRPYRILVKDKKSWF